MHVQVVTYLSIIVQATPLIVGHARQLQLELVMYRYMYSTMAKILLHSNVDTTGLSIQV